MFYNFSYWKNFSSCNYCCKCWRDDDVFTAKNNKDLLSYASRNNNEDDVMLHIFNAYNYNDKDVGKDMSNFVSRIKCSPQLFN